MKKILVPLDFSATSVLAFRFACDLAKQNKGEVLALYVVSLPSLPNAVLTSVSTFKDSYLKSIHVKSIEKFNALKNKYAETIKASLRVERGAVTDVIQKSIIENKISLVVMGTHGTSGLREFIIGSNTEKVVRMAEVPVIAIREYYKPSSIRNIILPVFRTD